MHQSLGATCAALALACLDATPASNPAATGGERARRQVDIGGLGGRSCLRLRRVLAVFATLVGIEWKGGYQLINPDEPVRQRVPLERLVL